LLHAYILKQSPLVMFRPGFRRLWLSESVGRAKAISDGSALAWPGLSHGPSTGKYQTIYIMLKCTKDFSELKDCSTR
jgi:hypothetical protein